MSGSTTHHRRRRRIDEPRWIGAFRRRWAVWTPSIAVGLRHAAGRVGRFDRGPIRFRATTVDPPTRFCKASSAAAKAWEEADSRIRCDPGVKAVNGTHHSRQGRGTCVRRRRCAVDLASCRLHLPAGRRDGRRLRCRGDRVHPEIERINYVASRGNSVRVASTAPGGPARAQGNRCKHGLKPRVPRSVPSPI